MTLQLQALHTVQLSRSAGQLGAIAVLLFPLYGDDGASVVGEPGQDNFFWCSPEGTPMKFPAPQKSEIWIFAVGQALGFGILLDLDLWHVSLTELWHGLRPDAYSLPSFPQPSFLSLSVGSSSCPLGFLRLVHCRYPR